MQGAKKGAKAAAAAAEAAAAEAALLQSRDEVERSADYGRWALMSQLPPHLAGRRAPQPPPLRCPDGLTG